MRSCCDANGGDLRYTLISLSHASLLVVGIRACKVMGEIRFAGSVFLARSFYHDAIVCLLASSRAVVCLIVAARAFLDLSLGEGAPPKLLRRFAAMSARKSTSNLIDPYRSMRAPAVRRALRLVPAQSLRSFGRVIPQRSCTQFDVM